MTLFGRRLSPSAHASTHESGGPDEISIAGLLGAIDHGGLSGRADDDHTQYHNDGRGDARYPLLFKGYDNSLHGYAYESIIAGTWTNYVNTVQMFCYYSYNTSANQNDEIEYEIFAEDGSKTLEILGIKNVNAAIMTVYLDGVSQGTIDQYADPTEFNKIFTLACTVVDTKVHSLKFKATGKHGSSSAYSMYITRVRIY